MSVTVADQEVHNPHLVAAFPVNPEHFLLRVHAVYITVGDELHACQNRFCLCGHAGTHADIFIFILPGLVVDMFHIHFVQQIGAHNLYPGLHISIRPQLIEPQIAVRMASPGLCIGSVGGQFRRDHGTLEGE